MSLSEVWRSCRRALNGTTLAVVFSFASLHCGDDDDEDHPPPVEVDSDGDAPVIPDRPIPQPGPNTPPNTAGGFGGRTSTDFGGNGGAGLVTGTAGAGLGIAGSGIGVAGSGFGVAGSGSDPFPGVAGSGNGFAGRSSF